MFIVRILLLPISFLYGVVMSLRNRFYDVGIFKSKGFDLPIISVGNIAVGGTGKTPHVEYIARLLKGDLKVATLSRGYGRKTKGYLMADGKMGHEQIGDEPLQFHSKYPDIHVAVDEKRVHGVNQLLKDVPDLGVVLLDDAFQHRSVVPGLNILLIRYSDIGEKQYMLPSGNLREWNRGNNRADVIVVTKSPSVFSPVEYRRITDVINPLPYQKVYYSYVSYKEPKAFNKCAKKLLEEAIDFDLKDYTVLLFTGIENSSNFKHYLIDTCKEVVSSDFKDHHVFSIAELLRIIKDFRGIYSKKKIIITTEKDSMRLKDERLFPILTESPVFYVPIEVMMHHSEDSFDTLIKEYVQRNKRIC